MKPILDYKNNISMKKIIVTTLSLLALGSIVSCSSNPIKSTLKNYSNYSLCWKIGSIKSHLGMNKGVRALGAFGTLGVSEIIRYNAVKDINIYLTEAKNRNLGNCTPKNLAEVDCKSIYQNIDNVDYKQCVLTTKRSIESRISADQSKQAANDAESAANYYKTQQLLKPYQSIPTHQPFNRLQ